MQKWEIEFLLFKNKYLLRLVFYIEIVIIVKNFEKINNFPVVADNPQST